MACPSICPLCLADTVWLKGEQTPLKRAFPLAVVAETYFSDADVEGCRIRNHTRAPMRSGARRGRRGGHPSLVSGPCGEGARRGSVWAFP